MKAGSTKSKMRCPECRSANTVKDGFAQHWAARKLVKTQRYRCKNCGRSFRVHAGKGGRDG